MYNSQLQSTLNKQMKEEKNSRKEKNSLARFFFFFNEISTF